MGSEVMVGFHDVCDWEGAGTRELEACQWMGILENRQGLSLDVCR